MKIGQMPEVDKKRKWFTHYRPSCPLHWRTRPPIVKLLYLEGPIVNNFLILRSKPCSYSVVRACWIIPKVVKVFVIYGVGDVYSVSPLLPKTPNTAAKLELRQ
jgi:hypothetical protein